MKKKYKIEIIINIFLTILGLSCTIYSLITSNQIAIHTVHACLFVLVIFYACIGYKKPHGNLLKLLLLIFAFSLLFTVNQGLKKNQSYSIIIVMISMMLICYVAGRLDRIKENEILMVLILILILSVGIIVTITAPNPNIIVGISGRFSNTILWIDICGAYFMRYKQHKEAGLLDGKK